MYVYQADVWCDSCGEAIRDELRAKGEAPEDESDEYSYDSDNFPKSCPDEDEADSPNHCAAQGECLEGIDLRDYGMPQDAALVGAESYTIGAPIHGLTSDGVDYLKEMLAEAPRTPYQEALYRYWRERFADYL